MFQIRTAFKSLPLRALTIMVCAVMLAVGAHFVFDATTNLQNTIRLKEMAQQTLKRAERAADYAFITLSEIISSGHDNCSADGVRYIQEAIYRRGVVKDVRVMDGQGKILCSGLAPMDQLPLMDMDTRDGVAARNENVQFHLIDMEDTGLVGLTWAVSQKRSMLAILNVDSLMFDVFPQSLRDEAAATLLLKDQPFARYLPSRESAGPSANWLGFSSSSERYPITAELRVRPQAFFTWNREAERYALLVAVLFGTLLGWIVILAASREEDREAILRKALKRGEFIGYVQPVFDLKTQAFTGGEALARWQRSDGSLVPPVEFIGLAEDSGLIVPITWQMMDNTLSQLSDYLRERPAMRIGFNIAPKHLMSAGFADELCARLDEHGVRYEQIIIEITERQPFEDILSAEIVIQKLRELGFVMSLDDTGTGHNGLSYVQNLGVDILKIDKHFVDLVGIDRVATKIVEMLVHLSYELNISTVAEGIETSAQLTVLKEMGVDKGQGYLIAKPLTPEMFMEAAELNSARGQVKNAA